MNVLLSAQKALIFRTHSGVLLLSSFHPMTQKYQLPVLMFGGNKIITYLCPEHKSNKSYANCIYPFWICFQILFQ